MPERTAIAIGQWGLRHLPIDRLGIFRNPDPRLAITLGGVRLANPLILSSMYYDPRSCAGPWDSAGARSPPRASPPAHKPQQWKCGRN